jgi:hypothetical protein
MGGVSVSQIVVRLLLVTVLSAGLGLHASTTVISQGNNPSDWSQNLFGPDFRTYAEVGWQTGPTGYTDVTITAMLLAADQTGDVVDAYLTSSIGPGATAVYEQDGITVSNNSYANVTLFSGIALAANTDYFLTLAPEAGSSLAWAEDATYDFDTSTFLQPPLVMDSGVSFLGPPGYCTDDGAGCNDPAPTSPFYDTGIIPIFSVTDYGSGTPEPSPGILVVAGLAAGWLLKLRKRRA